MRELDVKKHIAGVKDTVKITKAMQMIALSQMRKLGNRISSADDYFFTVKNTLQGIGKLSKKPLSPYLKANDSKKKVYLLIAGEKGLCGDYNIAVFKRFSQLIEKEASENVLVYCVGNSSLNYVSKRNSVKYNDTFLDVVREPSADDAYAVMLELSKLYESEEAGEIFVVYTDYYMLTAPIVRVEKLLPMELPKKEKTAKDKPLLFPDEKMVLDYLLTEYLIARLYSALMKAAYLESFKRMSTMQQATSNGENMIERLTLDYNKKRQERITNELIGSKLL